MIAAALAALPVAAQAANGVLSTLNSAVASLTGQSSSAGQNMPTQANATQPHHHHHHAGGAKGGSLSSSVMNTLLAMQETGDDADTAPATTAGTSTAQS